MKHLAWRVSLPLIWLERQQAAVNWKNDSFKEVWGWPDCCAKGSLKIGEPTLLLTKLSLSKRSRLEYLNCDKAVCNIDRSALVLKFIYKMNVTLLKEECVMRYDYDHSNQHHKPPSLRRGIHVDYYTIFCLSWFFSIITVGILSQTKVGAVLVHSL